jgi:hypothetical protein
MHEIHLSCSNSGWNASFLLDGAPSPEIVRLFETHTLPTAFSRLAHADDVIRVLETLNPGYRVSCVTPWQPHQEVLS